MKNTIKAFISLFLVFTMMVSIYSFNASAAGAVIAFSKNSVSVGDSVTVTVTLNAGEAMYAVGCVVNYDSSILEYKSGNATGGAGVLKIIESPSGETKVSYALTFTAKKSGSCGVSVADCSYSGVTEDKGLSGAAATITVKDATLSGNSNLKSLYLSSGTLSPAFSASITSYNVSVKNSVTECRISATAADSAAKVEVTGSATLKIGKNTRSVIVTAPNGTQKTYTINITRSETDDEVTSSEEPTDTNPLEVAVEGVNLTLASDISSVKLFNGFSSTQVDFRGTKVAVATDESKEFMIYYLKSSDSDELIPYIYDEKNEVFEKLKYYSQGEYTYIFADIPDDSMVPDTFYATNAKISGMDVKCYALSTSNTSDFYYIYCYSNGKYGFYRFDSRENVLQRYPELELEKIETLSNEKSDSVINRFKSLTNNAKIIVISLMLIILAAIALCVILIIKLVSRKKYDDFENGLISDEDFDTINIESFSEQESDSLPMDENKK